MGQIPESAKKVFSGVVFDVYQWDQEMYDGTTEVFEMLKRADTTEVIAVKDDKILIQEQEQPNKPRFLSFPGGRVEKGENPLVGAKRELLEETGFASDHWEPIHDVDPSSKFDWTIYVYIARECYFVQEMQLDAGEKITLRWVSFEELLDLVDSGELHWIEQDLRVELVRAKHHEPSRNTLKEMIFGGQ